MSARVRVPRQGYELAAQVGGDGEKAILLSNSLGAHLEMWDVQTNLLAPHYKVIRYDTRGHGQSDAPDGPYSFDELVADALAVLDHFDVARADFMGMSLGGMTGLGVALAAPDRIGRMICTTARADNPEPFVKSWDDRIGILREGGIEALWPPTVDRWLTPAFREADPAAVEKLRVGFVATSATGYEGCARALQQLDYLRHLGEMRVPTLYIAGAEDMGAPPAAMEAMAAATPTAAFHAIPACAHIANVNAETAFNALISDFLDLPK
ncbi:MAG: alpha/beta fold hydrolase [Rhodobacteraceae bacterium]|nr:alpha/beta fold hydrolase [Paracoccaceae bacterium]